MDSDEVVRIGIDLPVYLNERLAVKIPYGNKSRVIVNLLTALDHLIDEQGRGCILDIIDGKFIIATASSLQAGRDRSVQNLNGE